MIRSIDGAWRRLALLLLVAVWGTTVLAQEPGPEEDRLKILTDPESVKKKVDKDKSRPPLEMFRSQVAPFDILPYVKANHWSTLSLELRSNYNDFDGSLQTAPVPLAGLPQEVVYRRDARLLKTQRSRLGLQLMMPKVPKDIAVELNRPDAIRADEVWQANLRVLEPHQMLILFLNKETTEAYASWNRFQALYPNGADRADVQAIERQRYYRLVLPMEPDKPPVSPHPLTWTTISHVIWDGLPADNLNPTQQQALIDWIHWGGQLILVGGAGAPYNLLEDSFLSPFLPATLGGENALLDENALKPISDSFPPLNLGRPPGSEDESAIYEPEPPKILGALYRAAVPILPAPNKPVYFNGLQPKEGAVRLTVGDSQERLLGVEWRVGRGRVLMLAFNPTDPAFASWPGLDTLVRRVILRRPEESKDSRTPWTGRGTPTARFAPLPGPDLSWVRFLSRDLNTTLPAEMNPRHPTSAPAPPPSTPRGLPSRNIANETPIQIPDAAVAEWIDGATLPVFCVRQLEKASGIKIPASSFVLKVILAYLLLLVPLNWLVCRYVLNRRELAWLVVPVLALAFAIGVERAAAYDMGYDSASDEIDFLEIQGGYPRAHVSRFLSLYSTGRTRFSVSYPNDPTSLALPLDNGRSLRGEDVGTSIWRSYPTPTLEGYLVQPRSLAFVRAEQMATLDGSITLESDESGRRVVNSSRMPLRDAVVVDFSGGGKRREIPLGDIEPGESVALEPREPKEGRPAELPLELQPDMLLGMLREYFEDRPENSGEIRLVAWTPGIRAGQTIEPPVDRQRGFTAVVVHLKMGDPPPPFGPIYDASKVFVQATPPPQMQGMPRLGSMRPDMSPVLQGLPPSMPDSPDIPIANPGVAPPGREPAPNPVLAPSPRRSPTTRETAPR